MILLLFSVCQSYSLFATDFNCNEIKQSREYIEDLKSFVKEMANHYNQKKTSNLDLSTIGLGFQDNSYYLERNYPYILALNLSKNVLRQVDIRFLLRFPHTQTLDLSQNCLSSLEEKHRLAFMHIKILNVSQNLIQTVHPFTFSNISFEIIDLSHNR